MRIALFVAALVLLPLASAQEVRLEAATPFRADLVAGLTSLASAMQKDSPTSPCEDGRTKAACELAQGVVEDIMAAVHCIEAGHAVSDCLTALSGVFCLTFHVGPTSVNFAPPDVDELVLDYSVLGAGFETEVSPGSYWVTTDQYGLGTYRFTTSTTSACT